MEREAPPSDMLCSICKIKGLAWRCLDCVGGCSCCTSCLRHLHQRLPFHRIQSWDGSCFQPAWLYQAGVELHLGHDGERCPANQPDEEDDLSDKGVPWLSAAPSVDQDDEWEDVPFPEGDRPTLSAGFPVYKKRHHKLLVDRTGVHPMQVNLCHCPDAESQDLQYMATGLFPSSFLEVETAFTFTLLDDLRMDNLECKTAVQNFWHRLRRITAPLQPESVPVSLTIEVLRMV